MRHLLFTTFLVACTHLLSGQTPGPVEPYAAQGKAFASDYDTAKRMAIGDALKKVFEKKDDFFVRLFLSDLSLYSTLQTSDEKKYSGITGGVTVELRIRVDETAIAIIQNTYVEAVSAILTESEREIKTVQKLLDQGSECVKAQKFSQAWSLYSEAESRSQSVLSQVKSFNDETVRSDGGNPKSVVQKLAELRLIQAQDSLKRLKEIEKASLEGKAQTDLFDTYSAYEATQKGIDRWVSLQLEEAPFYDVPETILQKKLLDLENKRGEISLLKDKYHALEGLSQSLSLLFQARLSQARTDLSSLERGLNKIQSDLELELRDPRIGRIEKDRQSRVFWAEINGALAKSAKAAFLRETQEIVALRVFFPLQLKNDLWEFSSILPFSFKVEGQYSDIWLMTRFDWIPRDVYGDSLGTYKNSSMSQTVALGYGNPVIYGLGYQWDWRRVVNQGIFSTIYDADLRSRGHLYLGYVDKSLGWPLVLMDGWFEYGNFSQVASFFDGFNLGIEGTLRFTRWVKLEMGLSSHVLASLNGVASLDREGAFWLGIGFRFPSPFLWGLRYENMSIKRLADDAKYEYSTWKFFFEYSL